jgi:hypothetical protein
MLDLACLGRYGALCPLAGAGIDRNHAGQEDELAGPDAR